MSIDNNSPRFTGEPLETPRTLADLSRPKGHSTGVRKSKNGRGKHRAQFPSPGFYLFSFLLNISAAVIITLLLVTNYNIPLMALGLLGIIGMIVSIYSLTIRPKESNRKLRKILIVTSVIFGFVIILALAASILLNPSGFTL